VDLAQFREFVANLGNQPEKRGRPRKVTPVTAEGGLSRRVGGTGRNGQVSSRQQAALSQTNNDVKAIYHKDFRKTPVRHTATGLTLNVGGNCESAYYTHGRAVIMPSSVPD
jgi:hypothetical protein